MCRSIADSGKEQSACVACRVVVQASCIDIDSGAIIGSNDQEDSLPVLRGKRGLAWAWYSYPGFDPDVL